MKREEKTPGPSSAIKTAKNDPLLKELPALIEALTSLHWDDGKPREVWVLSISFETGQLMVKVSDKQGRRTAQVIAGSIEEAFIEINAHIDHGTLTWRAWGKDGKR